MTKYFTEEIIEKCTFEELPREVICYGKAFTETTSSSFITGYCYLGTIYITKIEVIPEND